jgi:hypothetical protein
MIEQPVPSAPDQPEPGVTTAALWNWIDATRTLVRRARAAAEEAELASITAHADRAGSRVAIVATSTRARSRLVGQLVGRDLLPPDPGIDIPVLITAGGDDRLEMQTERGWSGRPAGTKGAHDGPTADGSAGAPEPGGPWWKPGDPPVLAFWLRSSLPDLVAPGAELISISPPAPGSALDPSDRQWTAICSADALILVVPATAAMAQAETALLTELPRAGIAADRVLILISRMDLVEADERAGVLAYVRNRAARISPSFVILPPGSVDQAESRLADQAETDATAEPELVASAREWVATWVQADVAEARARQLARQLTRCLRRVADGAAEAAREARREQEQEAAAAATAATALADDLRDFDMLREDVRGRHNAALAEFLGQRERFAAQLAQDMLHQLDASADPAAWWERELPYQLQHRLSWLDQQVRQTLQQRVSRSAQLLAEGLSSRFGVQPRQLTGVTVPEPAAPAADAPEFGTSATAQGSLKSLRRRRVLYRMGPPGVALLAFLVVPGIGPIAGLGASLIGAGLMEIRLRNLADEQRIEIRKRLPGLLDTVLNAYGDQVYTALSEVYRQHETEVGLLRERWQANAGTPAAVARGPGPWEALQSDCQALIDQIRARSDAASGVAAMAGPASTEMGA